MNDQVSMQMPKYKSHKEVYGLQSDAILLDSDKAHKENCETDGSAMLVPVRKEYGPIRVDREYLRKHDPRPGGYYVVYKDGYKSFLPAKAFEDGYTEIV